MTEGGSREEGRTKEADLVGQEERQSRPSKPVIPLSTYVTHMKVVGHNKARDRVRRETLCKGVARPFTRAITSWVVQLSQSCRIAFSVAHIRKG